MPTPLWILQALKSTSIMLLASLNHALKSMTVIFILLETSLHPLMLFINMPRTFQISLSTCVNLLKTTMTVILPEMSLHASTPCVNMPRFVMSSHPSILLILLETSLHLSMPFSLVSIMSCRTSSIFTMTSNVLVSSISATTTSVASVFISTISGTTSSVANNGMSPARDIAKEMALCRYLSCHSCLANDGVTTLSPSPSNVANDGEPQHCRRHLQMSQATHTTEGIAPFHVIISNIIAVLFNCYYLNCLQMSKALHTSPGQFISHYRYHLQASQACHC
jgi:hypothetical protein